MLIHFVHNCQNSWNNLQLKETDMSILALFRLFLIMLFDIVRKNLEQMTRPFCETIVWGEIRTLLLLSILSTPVQIYFSFLLNRPRVMLGQG